MRSWLMFDKMITPILLRIGFVLAVLAALAAGIASGMAGQVLRGIVIAVFGIIGARISWRVVDPSLQNPRESGRDQPQLEKQVKVDTVRPPFFFDFDSVNF